MSLLNEFCIDFGVQETDLGTVTRFSRACFLTNPEQTPIIEGHKELFGAGIYLGEEKKAFTASPALLELLAARTHHKTIVDEKAAWLFLCGRDILTKGIVKQGRPTKTGLILVQNALDENLGYGEVNKGVAVKNVLDRGFFLRRERLS